jgi:hypothetical protein
MRKSERRALERIAYHEAGHAVMSVICRRPFSFATIIPASDYAGLVQHPAFPADFQPDLSVIPGARHSKLLEDHILISLAGAAAEDVFVGRAKPRREAGNAVHDYKIATQMALHVTGDPNEASAYVTWLLHRARNKLRVPHNWLAVELVTNALLDRQRLSYRATRRVIEDGRERVMAQRVVAHPVFGAQAPVPTPMGEC